MRSLELVAALGLLAGTSVPLMGQGADMTRYHRAAVRALDHENAGDLLNQAMKGKKPDQARAAGQQLAARGAARLKGDDLKRRAELMLQFTDRAGSKVCGAWARGTVSPQQTADMVATLDSTEFDAWLVLSVRAMVAELKNKPKAFTGSQDDLSKMFAAMATAMTATESQRFNDVMSNFDKASNEDACWFGQQLYRSALALDGKRREHALKTLAWIEVQPS
ncbi:MAG TPA: hypothetical protein VFU40_11530 [Gemmatimonadales bacterium]|nr:hypothetical protein [Gemmatimonadales bacterium]